MEQLPHEILCLIYARLRMRDVLVCARVCKNWLAGFHCMRDLIKKQMLKKPKVFLCIWCDRVFNLRAYNSHKMLIDTGKVAAEIDFEGCVDCALKERRHSMRVARKYLIAYLHKYPRGKLRNYAQAGLRLFKDHIRRPTIDVEVKLRVITIKIMASMVKPKRLHERPRSTDWMDELESAFGNTLSKPIKI